MVGGGVGVFMVVQLAVAYAGADPAPKRQGRV